MHNQLTLMLISGGSLT